MATHRFDSGQKQGRTAPVRSEDSASGLPRTLPQEEGESPSFMHDVSDEHCIQPLFTESMEKFRALVEEALVGVSLIQSGRFRYVNQTYARIFGYEQAEMIDTFDVLTVIHPDDRPLARESLRRRFEGEVEAVHYQVRGLTKQGTTIHIEIYGKRFNYQGRAAVIGTVLDVTKRWQLQRDLCQVQEEERKRLGQDLHDGVASQLSGVAFMLGALARRAEGDPDMLRRIREVQALVRESCEDVRRLSIGLSPVGMSESNLSCALSRLVLNTPGCHFETSGELPELPAEVAAHLYWIAHEAIANARTHAGATHVAVRLEQQRRRLALSITDDGTGFCLADLSQEEGLGLRTMHYRAEILGAELTVDTAPGAGTCITCKVLV